MLNFDGIMKDALEVGLLTTNELDRLTDEVASGAKTEAGLAGRCNRGSEEARGQWGLPPATLNTPTQGVCFMCVSCPCRVLHSHD